MGSGFGDILKGTYFFNPNDDDDELTIPYYKPLISEQEAKEIFGDAIKYPPISKDPWDYYPIPPKTCHHEWVNYTGLQETFQYCKVCQEKKNA